MASAAFSPGYQRATPRQRATAAIVAIAIEVLIALALLTMGTRRETATRPEEALKSFSVAPNPQRAAPQHPTERSATKQRAAAAPPPPRGAPPPVPVLTKPAPTATVPGLIPMDLSKADIGKMPSHTDADGTETTDVAGSGSVYGPGEGPGGVRLYNVAWYREPTHAELAGYLPNGAPPGSWAEIACKMIEHYHVENCRSLGESPVGSGLARSMRQAAWQFLVRPPRVGDKVLIGSWVRIRISFSSEATEDKSSAPGN